ncbi:MAG: hypothetical protein V1800_08670 [Candidatus Latescibacterota bacterium]
MGKGKERQESSGLSSLRPPAFLSAVQFFEHKKTPTFQKTGWGIDAASASLDLEGFSSGTGTGQVS